MALRDRFRSPDHANNYKRFRPDYAPEVLDVILGFLKEERPGPHTKAIDIGCGSGQFTFQLASHFDKVLGTDISEAQVEAGRTANGPANVEFRVSNFDQLFLGNGSTDLVTVASAVHWFEPIEDFYREVDRVLKPGGVLALLTYDYPTVSIDGKHSTKFSDEVQKFFHDPRFVPLRTEKYKHFENQYADFKIPYPVVKRITDLEKQADVTLSELLGLVTSWSFVVKYRQEYTNEPDPVDQFQKRFQDLIGPQKALGEFKCRLHYPTYLVMGRKPL